MKADSLGISTSAYLSNTLYSNTRGFEHSVFDSYALVLMPKESGFMDVIELPSKYTSTH